MDTKVNKSGDTMTGMLQTTDHFRTIGKTTRIVEVNSADNSKTWGTFEVNKNSDTETAVCLFAFNPSDNNKNAKIGIHIKGDEKWADCPSSNRNNSIVTTVSHGSNYVRFGNGLQICWFYPQISSSGDYKPTITLPIPFKDYNYLALVQQTGESPSNEYTNTISILGKTTTNFVIRKSMREAMYLQVLCVGYWY